MTSVHETESAPRVAPRPARRLLLVAGIVVVAWFGVAEIVTRAWYSSHETGVPRNHLPASGEIVVQRLRDYLRGQEQASNGRKVDETSMSILKASFGETVTWRDGGWPTALTTLKWDEDSRVGGAESMHNPGNCLRAAGWKVGARTDYGIERYGDSTCEVVQWEVSQGDLKMLAFSAVFGRFSDPAAVGTSMLASSKARRMRSVFEGRRDAPIYIILGYLPLPPGSKEPAVHAQFQRILSAIFGDSPTAGALPRGRESAVARRD